MNTSNESQPAAAAIGFLHYGSPGANPENVTAFRDGLRAAGCVDGEDVAIRFYWAEGDYDRLNSLAADLVRHEVAVIFASNSCAVSAVRNASATVPSVFISGASPVAWGLESGERRSARNMTVITVGLAAKWLALLGELVPDAGMVGMPVNPDNPENEIQTTDLQLAALQIRKAMNVRRAGSEADIDTVIGEFAERGFGGLFVPDDAFYRSRCEQFVALAARHAMPAIYHDREFTAAGGLMSCRPDMTGAYRQAGIYCGRIVRGETTAGLPAFAAEKFEIAVNLETARTLGLTIPQSVLAQDCAVIG